MLTSGLISIIVTLIVILCSMQIALSCCKQWINSGQVPFLHTEGKVHYNFRLSSLMEVNVSIMVLCQFCSILKKKRHFSEVVLFFLKVLKQCILFESCAF